MDSILILSIALLIDITLGDPPTYFHPVGWMGKMIAFMARCAPQKRARAQLIYGSLMVLIGIAIFSVPVYFLLDYMHELHRIAFVVGGAILLKSTFSITGLRRAAVQVKKRLSANDLKGAQTQTGYLVSRDTGDLTEPMIVAATVESISENTSDSIVAPLFWFLILGVPGAIGYRMANTFDAMVGYHGKYEHLGKFAARLDDVLNFIPARLTGVMIVLASRFSTKNMGMAWRTMIRDHAKTESPNAGWPMSAAAGSLEVQLVKIGHYKLGEANHELSSHTIDAILRLMFFVTFIWILLCLVFQGVRFGLTS